MFEFKQKEKLSSQFFMSVFQKCILQVIARSALYVRAHSQNWNVRSSVRPESNYFLRRGYEGGHVPLDLGVLNDRFSGFENF